MVEGAFSSQTLAEKFRDLYLGERSGVLHLCRGPLEKRIYFDRGMILFADSEIEDEDLGRRLVSEGKISAGALLEAKRNISEPKDLAQALVNRGLISKEALSHTLRFIVERVVQSVFQWEGGTARYSDGWLLQEIFETDILRTFEVILKGISNMVGFEPIRDAMLGVDSRLQIRRPTPVPLEKLALTPAHGFILSRVDGTTRVGEVVSLLPPGEEDLACRFLYGLLVMGVAVYDPPPAEGPFRVATILRDHADQLATEERQEKTVLEAYGAMVGKSPCEILGVSSGATREEIERAYEEAKAPFVKGRLLTRVREKLRSELAVIESRLVESYLTLTQARLGDAAGRREEHAQTPAREVQGAGDLLVRVELDKTRTKMAQEENSRLADAHFSAAKRSLREGDYFNAIQYLKLAISYCPEEARYYYILGDCQARNPEARWQRMAEQNLIQATKLDPWNADYRVLLGRFYKRRGLKIRARKQFEHALQIVPSHEVALEELKSLN